MSDSKMFAPKLRWKDSHLGKSKKSILIFWCNWSLSMCWDTFITCINDQIFCIIYTAIIQKNFFPYRYLKLEDPSNYKTTLDNIWPKECAAECLARTDYSCRSFDYDRTLFRCFLSDVDMSNAGTVPTDDSYPIDHYETGE